METKKIAIIGVLVIVLIILCCICAFAFLNQNKESIEINDLNIEKDQWGIYIIKGHITALMDLNYIEARITLYDDQGAIVGECPLAWNMKDIKAGQKVSVGSSLGATASETPSYGVVTFYDAVNSKEPLANFTVHFNSTDNQTDTSSGSATIQQKSNNTDNDNKKYTQEDIDMAKNEAYWQGYDDSVYDSINYYDDIETSTDESSSYSSSSSGSSHSSVETTEG